MNFTCISPALLPRGFSERLSGRFCKRLQYGLETLANLLEAAGFRFRSQVRIWPPSALEPLGKQNGIQRFHGIRQAVVNQNIVVFLVILKLTLGRSEAALDNRFRVLTAAAQSLLQFTATRRQNENADRIRHRSLNLSRALHVDIEQQVLAVSFRFNEKVARSAVVVAENVGMFEQFIFANPFLKLLTGHEIIFAAVLFGAARLASGVRNGKFQVGNLLPDFIDQRGLARSGRRGDDEDRSHYSMFCTSWRPFSISDFMAKPASLMRSASPARPEVLESRVLASRFISCSRKSSFLPISPFSSSNPRRCCTWFSRRTNSS